MLCEMPMKAGLSSESEDVRFDYVDPIFFMGPYIGFSSLCQLKWGLTALESWWIGAGVLVDADFDNVIFFFARGKAPLDLSCDANGMGSIGRSASPSQQLKDVRLQAQEFGRILNNDGSRGFPRWPYVSYMYLNQGVTYTC